MYLNIWMMRSLSEISYIPIFKAVNSNVLLQCSESFTALTALIGLDIWNYIYRLLFLNPIKLMLIIKY